MEKEQHVIGDRTAPREHFHCEEIDTGQDRHVGCDEILPTGFRAAFLMGNLMSEVGQRSDDPVITLAWVFLGHSDDEFGDCTRYRRPARIGAVLGSVELACDQPAVPSQDRFGLGHACNLRQRVAPEPLSDFSKR
jgi:hypothetical protein